LCAPAAPNNADNATKRGNAVCADAVILFGRGLCESRTIRRCARRSISEAMTAVETIKETWCEAEVHPIAGEIALMMPPADAIKAEGYFDRLPVRSGRNHGNCARR
jgi:hypothetical protein